MQPPTPLHHLLFPPRGTLTPFRRRLPPVSPAPFLPVVTALPPMASPAQQRQPSTTQSKGVIGPFTHIRVEERMHVRYTYARSKIIEKILGESGVAGVSPWRRRPRPSPPPRSTVIFFSPPGFVSRVYAILSRSLACALLRCTLRFQPRPTRREIGNLKSKLRTAACRAHPRPSFSRITLDHRWSSRAWYQTRGCVIELGK